MAVIAVLADITEVRELRETALRRAKVIEKQLGELQGASREIEARNAALSLMTRKVQIARVAATLFVVALFVAIGAWHVRPLDLFREAVAPQALAGAEAGEPAALHTMTVEPDSLRSTLSLRGHLAPGRVVKVVSPVESHVSGVHVRYGQRVAAGIRWSSWTPDSSRPSTGAPRSTTSMSRPTGAAVRRDEAPAPRRATYKVINLQTHLTERSPSGTPTHSFKLIAARCCSMSSSATFAEFHSAKAAAILPSA